MEADRGLLRAVAQRTSHYTDKAPVFQVEHRSVEQLSREPVDATTHLWRWFPDCSVRPHIDSLSGITTLLLPDDGQVVVWHPSGAMVGSWQGALARMPLAQDEKTADRGAITARAEEATRKIANDFLRPQETLRFERLWQIEATAVSLKGERGRVALLARPSEHSAGICTGSPTWAAHRCT